VTVKESTASHELQFARTLGFQSQIGTSSRPYAERTKKKSHKLLGNSIKLA
jgi:hypothetical protein